MRPVLPATIVLVAMTALLTACSFDNPQERPTVTPKATATSTAPPTYPAATATPDVRLTVSLLPSNAAPAATRHLVCVGSSAVAGTDFPGGDEACEVVATSPEVLVRDLAKADDKCLGTGNQDIADVFGAVNDRSVRNSFRQDNSCNTETWNLLEPLLGPVDD
jgi:hypothetical protein